MSNLKILRAEVENFKNLTSTTVDMKGKSMMIVGPNRVGKSSFIQALMSPFLSTYKPLTPVTEGEERGSIVVKIGGDLDGEEVEYSVEMYFSPEHQKGRLKMYSKDGGEVKGAKGILDSMIGDISFDIDLFLQQAKTPSGGHSSTGVKNQIDMLKSFMSKEVLHDIDQCDIDRLAVFSTRKELSAEVKILKAQNAHEYTDEELETYSELKDEEKVSKSMAEIGEKIENWNKVSNGLESLQSVSKTNKAIIESKDRVTKKYDAALMFVESMTEFKNEMSVSTMLTHASSFMRVQRDELDHVQRAVEATPEVEEKITKGEAWLVKHPTKPSMEALLAEQKEIQEHNEKAKEVLAMIERHKTIKTKEDMVVELTAKIEGFVASKKKLFIDNPLPVKGLTFDENNVLYKGLALNEEQHPSSVIISVGVAIAMAKNPNLKIIIIRDGSLLDKDTYNKILGMVEKKGFQLFIEMVDWEGNDMEVKFAERFE